LTPIARNWCSAYLLLYNWSFPWFSE